MKMRKEELPVALRVLRPMGIGAGVGVLVCLLLLLLAAAVMASVSVPTGAVTPLALVIMAVSGLVGGFTAARLSRERGLLVGAGCGLLLFLVVAIAGFAVAEETTGSLLFLKLALTVGCGALGGVLGVNVKHR